ncbi:MarR family transcriptional regulator [Mesorhizobium sp. SP-1A]|uniref:MarR family winged helix-turn-helix transcriptional regulator n=1 Tax=Mesorhizobium sp. SP-1A TaxID=3077840 RepID=UPI0028F6E059|nr:MarR family transcriptional regulator [Mesorhizobium sp. SP-1A]
MPPHWTEFAPLLNASARGWRKAFDTAMADHQLSDATALPLLALIRQGDGIPQGLLAERVGVEGPTIVRIVDGLERDGFVTREADESDRRVKLVRLTAEGRKRAELADCIATKLRVGLLADLPPEQVEAAMAVLHRIVERTK